MISIERTAELARIVALPRRALDPATAEAHAAELTPLLALDSTVALRPWQAQALVEAHACHGAWLALPVGTGKTLLSWLLPTVLDSARCVLVIPASLVEKTRSDFGVLAQHWRAPKLIVPLTREYAATEPAQSYFDEFAPDLIIIDESDDLSNARSSCVRRIDRYVRAHPSVRVVAMTGTPSRKSLLAYWHQLAWALGDGAPIPLGADEAKLWALALDEHRMPGRPSPGPLGRTLREARAWYRDRLVSTPGVLVVDEDSCDAPLHVRVTCADDDESINAAFDRFARDWETPAGIPVSDPLSRWLLDAQLGLGLYSQWAPAPPDEWRDARRNVARFVRETIARSTRSSHPLDTEAQVLRRYPDAPEVATWLRVRPTFDGATETIWFSDATLLWCLAWIKAQREPAVVWCGNVAFGRELASRAYAPYYGPQGRTDAGGQLHDAKSRTIIASWNANKKGFNLQRYTRVLIVMPPQSAKWLEQIIGRSHRAGQTQAVHVDVLATSGGTLDAFDEALAEARCVRAREGLTQKLLRAHIERDKPASMALRWARQTKEV